MKRELLTLELDIFLAENSIRQYDKKYMTDAINLAGGGNLPDMVMDYANIFTDLYSSSLQQASNILERTGGGSVGRSNYKPFYAEGPRSNCNIELYTGFWYASFT